MKFIHNWWTMVCTGHLKDVALEVRMANLSIRLGSPTDGLHSSPNERLR